MKEFIAELELKRLQAERDALYEIGLALKKEIERLTREKAHHLEERLNAGKAMKAAQDAAHVAEAERDRLRAALEEAPCPRPCNGRPEDLTVNQCCNFHECGCIFGEALGRSEPLRGEEK